MQFSGLCRLYSSAMPAYRRLRMPRKHPQVLGVDLNRSESRCWACPRKLSRLIALDELGIVPPLWSCSTRSPYFLDASLAVAHLRASTRRLDSPTTVTPKRQARDRTGPRP